MELERIECPARDVRHGKQDDLGCDQKYDGADKDPTLATQELPQVTIEMQYGTGSWDAGLGRLTHVS
jgi:hypothetical protein